MGLAKNYFDQKVRFYGRTYCYVFGGKFVLCFCFRTRFVRKLDFENLAKKFNVLILEKKLILWFWQKLESVIKLVLRFWEEMFFCGFDWNFNFTVLTKNNLWFWAKFCFWWKTCLWIKEESSFLQKKKQFYV